MPATKFGETLFSDPLWGHEFVTPPAPPTTPATALLPTLKLEINFEDDPSPGFYDVVQAWSPLAYWRLDELSGTVAEDASGNGFDGTYTGGVVLNQPSELADGDPSALFDGTDDRVVIAHDNAFQNLIPPWTLAAWIKPTAARDTDDQYASIITYQASSSSIPFALNYGRSDAGFAAASCVWCGYFRQDVTGGVWLSISDPTPVKLNEWQHYIAVAELLDGWVWLSLYRNGVRVAGPTRQAQVGGAGAASMVTRIGRRSTSATGEYFPGGIDEAVIFSRALAPVEAAKLYSSSYATLAKTAWVELPAPPSLPSRIRTFSSRRGRADSVARVEAGEATVTCYDHDFILAPDPLANLVSNPSFEENVTTGWTPVNGTAARDTTLSVVGVASCKLTSAGSGDCYITTGLTGLTSGLRPGRTYTFRAQLRAGSGTPTGLVRAIDKIAGSADSFAVAQPLSSSAWSDLTVTRAVRSLADEAFLEVGFQATGAGQIVYIDAVQIEESAGATGYADGDQPNCRWNGERHLSPTHRAQQVLTGGYASVLPDRLARLTCEWDGVTYGIIYGRITDYDYEYPSGGAMALCTLRIVEELAPLAAATLSQFSRPSETEAERVAACLKAGGVPADNVEIDTASCNTNKLRAITGGDAANVSVLEHIRACEETTGGLLFFKGDGTAFYHGASYRDVTAREEVVLTDRDPLEDIPDFEESPYSDLAVSYDDQNVENDVTLTNTARAWSAQIVDPVSLRRHGTRSAARQSQFEDPIAVARPRTQPIPRIEPITVIPANNPAELWPAILGLEISDLVRVERGWSRDVLKDYVQWVEGVGHTRSGNDWKVTLPTSAEIVTGAPPVSVVAQGIAEPVLLTAGRVANFAGGVGSVTFDSKTYRADRFYALALLTLRNDTDSPSDPTSFTSANTWQQIISTTQTGGSFFGRFLWYYILPTGDMTEQVTVNFAGAVIPESVDWAVIEIEYGFAASPIGVANFASGSSQAAVVDVGTLAGNRSRVLAHSYQFTGSVTSWGRFFELHESDPQRTDDWSVAYGPEGTDVATATFGAAEGWGIQAFEVKAG